MRYYANPKPKKQQYQKQGPAQCFAKRQQKLIVRALFMKLEIFLPATVLSMLAALMPSAVWPQTAPVTGFYDAANDWIVFKWNNPTDGQMQTILDSGNKILPTIHASAVPDPASGGFAYRYNVANGSGAHQLLMTVYVAHPAAKSDTTAPTEWYQHEQAGKGYWSWSKVMGSTHGIPAGQSASGFSFKSRGLPGIVDAKFAGKRRQEYSGPGDDDSDEIHASFSSVFANLKKQYPNKFIDIVRASTLGPVPPPTVFNAASFIQNLIALVNQSRAQGWIDSDGIKTSLLTKLDTAASKITTDMKTAKNTLNVFMNDVSAQNGKHISSEAYALLYFNAQYAVNHLRDCEETEQSRYRLSHSPISSALKPSTK